jgi:hypothetical protein
VRVKSECHQAGWGSDREIGDRVGDLAGASLPLAAVIAAFLSGR